MVVSKVLKLKIAYFREMRTEINGGGSELKHVLQNPGAWTTIIALALSHSVVLISTILYNKIQPHDHDEIRIQKPGRLQKSLRMRERR